MAIIFMIPFEIYEVQENNLFPALYLLIIIFSIAFIYVFVETVFLFVKDEKRFDQVKPVKISKDELKQLLIQYFMGYFIILFMDNIVFSFFSAFRVNNAGLLIVVNMLLLLFVYRLVKNCKQMLLILSVFILLNVGYYGIFGFGHYAVNLKMLIIILAIMLYRNISEKYNYQEIEIEELKSRMILSFESVLMFYGSRVNGLPKSTDETTDSRLTEEEVESIKRWSKTKRGTDRIIVVRHMPFAPFILIGEIVFFCIRVYF